MSKEITIQRKFAVFDIDGTLFRSALYHEVVDELARQGKLGKDSWQRISEARQLWKQRTHPDSFWDFVNASVTEFETALPHIHYDDYLSVIQLVFEMQKDHVYQYTKQLLNDLKSKGYTIIAISGSNQEMVDPFAAYHGFDIAIGAEFEVKNGLFTGKNKYMHENKHVMLERLIQENNFTLAGSVAIGDTHRDISILSVVEQPIAFNPNRQLFEHAKQHGWKVVIERKNMWYELEASNGSYILAQTND